MSGHESRPRIRIPKYVTITASAHLHRLWLCFLHTQWSDLGTVRRNPKLRPECFCQGRLMSLHVSFWHAVAWLKKTQSPTTSPRSHRSHSLLAEESPQHQAHTRDCKREEGTQWLMVRDCPLTPVVLSLSKTILKDSTSAWFRATCESIYLRRRLLCVCRLRPCHPAPSAHAHPCKKTLDSPHISTPEVFALSHCIGL